MPVPAIDQLLAWLRENAPRTATQALPGASEAQVAEAEDGSTVTWTPELRHLYASLNGWRRSDESGTSLFPMKFPYSLAELRERHRMLTELRGRHVADESDQKQDSGQKQYWGYTREELSHAVEDVPSTLDETTGEYRQLTDAEWLGYSEELTGAGRERGHDEALEREYERVGAQWARMRPRAPATRSAPGAGRAGSPTELFPSAFIPIAGLDGYEIVVDLRPGADRGCVGFWDNVEGYLGAAWPDLNDLFEALLDSLRNGAEFAYFRPRIEQGVLEWDPANEDPRD